MPETTVDARGKLCPLPLIMTRKALGEIAIGDTLRVLIDNEVSKNNVERFLADNGFVSSCAREGTVFTLTVAKSKEDLARPDAAAYCSTAPQPSGKGHCMVIARETMGSGADELGTILMKAFINTIKEVTPLPSSIIFYNGGIHLAAEGSPLLESLAELQAAGVEILVCGTCANYFNKSDAIRVGTISNMYTILETLTAADKVIVP